MNAEYVDGSFKAVNGSGFIDLNKPVYINFCKMKTPKEVHDKKLDRLNTFIDAVLAIVITLLVLDLKVPVLNEINSTAEMMEKLVHLLPHVYAFLLCFLAVAQCWISLNAINTMITKYSNTLGLISVANLLPFSLLPFSAAMIGEYPNNPGSYVIFGGLYFISTVIVSIYTTYIWKKKILSENVDLEKFKNKIYKLRWVSPFIVLTIIGTSFINTCLSMILFVLMLLL